MVNSGLTLHMLWSTLLCRRLYHLDLGHSFALTTLLHSSFHLFASLTLYGVHGSELR